MYIAVSVGRIKIQDCFPLKSMFTPVHSAVERNRTPVIPQLIQPRCRHFGYSNYVNISIKTIELLLYFGQ